jgi:hypothetical protein
VRLAVGVDARRHDADALAFEHRKRSGAEIENDVAHVAVGASPVSRKLPVTVAMAGLPRL